MNETNYLDHKWYRLQNYYHQSNSDLVTLIRDRKQFLSKKPDVKMKYQISYWINIFKQILSGTKRYTINAKFTCNDKSFIQFFAIQFCSVRTFNQIYFECDISYKHTDIVARNTYQYIHLYPCFMNIDWFECT